MSVWACAGDGVPYPPVHLSYPGHLTARRAVTVAVESTFTAARGKSGEALRDRGGLAILLIWDVVALELSAAGLSGQSVVGALACVGSEAEKGDDGDGEELHVCGAGAVGARIDGLLVYLAVKS